MNGRAVTLAGLALLLAAASPHVYAQTAHAIPLYSPKPKPAPKPTTITLDAPKVEARTHETRAAEADDEPITPSKPPTPTQPATAPAPAASLTKPATKATPRATPTPQDIKSGVAKAKPGAAAQPRIVSTNDPPASEAPIKSFAPEPVLDTALAQQIRLLAAASHGKVALYAWQLNTGKAVALDADQTVETAAVVPLALLWETLRQVALGDTTWDDRITTATLRDAARQMVLGDTAVPGQLVTRFTLKRVNQDLSNLGYNEAWGKPVTGRTTPRQMVRLLQHIGMCDLDLPRQLHVNSARADAACRTAVSLTRNQLYSDALPNMPAPQHATVFTAGTASPAQSQGAIVAARTGPIVVAIYSYDIEDHRALQTAIAAAIVKAWSPQGLDGALLDVPHLGVSWD